MGVMGYAGARQLDSGAGRTLSENLVGDDMKQKNAISNRAWAGESDE